MPNRISIFYRLDQSILNGCLVLFFIFIQIVKETSVLQTVENLIRRRVLRRLISICTVCRLSHKKDARLIWDKKFSREFYFREKTVKNTLAALKIRD